MKYALQIFKFKYVFTVPSPLFLATGSFTVLTVLSAVASASRVASELKSMKRVKSMISMRRMRIMRSTEQRSKVEWRYK